MTDETPDEADDVPEEQEAVRIEAMLPRRTFEEVRDWGEEIGCGAGFVLWAVVADAVHKQPDNVRPRVAAAWEEAQEHGFDADQMGGEAD